MTKENNGKIHSTYLQSDESAIIMEASFRICKDFVNEIRIIGHFYDGNTCLIPKKFESQFLTSWERNLKDVSHLLNLAYPMKAEVKFITGEANLKENLMHCSTLGS